MQKKLSKSIDGYAHEEQAKESNLNYIYVLTQLGKKIEHEDVIESKNDEHWRSLMKNVQISQRYRKIVQISVRQLAKKERKRWRYHCILAMPTS